MRYRFITSSRRVGWVGFANIIVLLFSSLDINVTAKPQPYFRTSL